MMFTLTREPETTFEYDGVIVKVNMAFDNILRLYELFDDQLYSNFEKIVIALKMLIEDFEPFESFSLEQQIVLYKFIMKEFLDIDLNKQDDKEQAQQEIMDFSKDAGLIYASFLNAYNIDLFKEHGKLHWYKFSNLLVHLPDKTPFKTVVEYRQMKVPTGKYVSEEYKKHVRKMKRLYSLEDEIDDNKAAKMLDNKLSIIANGLKRRNK